MTLIPARIAPLTSRAALGALFLLALATGACSDDSSNNPGGGPGASSTYVGLLASDDGQTGPLNLTFASPVAAPPQAGTGPSFSSAVVNVTGTLSLGGGPLVNITGTLDDDDFLTMSGGGYDLFGDLDHGIIIGGFTNAGIVLITGSLVAASSSEGSPAYAFCGQFNGTSVGDPPTEDSGTFNMVVASGTATGVAYDDEGSAIPLQGTSTSSSVSISLTDPDSGGMLTASGTYNGTSISGTYSVTLGGAPISSGTFTGSICGSQT